MKAIVLQGSPRKQGNTKQFSDYFMEELRREGVDVQEVWLYDLDIRPCLACQACQTRPGEMGCPQKDDTQTLFRQCLEADLLVFSSPIYAFFAPAPVKAFMDRFIYASGKYYGSERYEPLTKGKRCAVLATSGYPTDHVVPIFADAVRRTCKHIGMVYLGAAAARDMGAGHVFMTPEKAEEARTFAHTVLENMRDSQSAPAR